MKKFLVTSLLCFLFPAWVCAQAVVVRVDKDQIYLDTSELPAPPQVGDNFKVILSTEKLTNPQTGKELGEINNYSDTGTISEVHELFAVGKITAAEEIKTGMQAVLQAPAPAAATTATAATDTQKDNAPIVKQTYDPVEKTIISISSGPVVAPDADNIVLLSEDNEVSVWERAADDKLNLLLTYHLPKGKQALSVSAAPVKEDETLAQIFVSIYDERKKNIFTLVLENQDGKLVQTALLPYFTKEIGCGKNKTVWAQRPFVLADRPGNARQLVFKDGKYAFGENTFSTQRNWLTGVNYFNVEKPDAPNLIYTSSTGTIRMILANGKRAESRDRFAATPNRLLHKQQIIKFYPSVQVTGEAGNARIVAVENTAKLGLLSNTFGQYKNAVLHRLTYEKGRLQEREKTELDGVVYDTACSDDFILTAEVLPDGTSSVVEISK